MNKFFKGIVKRIDSLLSSSGKISSKRLAFLMTVMASIVWLSCDLHNHGMTDNWLQAFTILVVSTIGGYVGGAALEKKNQSNQTE